MEEPRYFYSVDGTDVQGPQTLGELQQLFVEGALNAETQLCPEGTEDWHPINLAYFPSATTTATAEAPPATPAATLAPASVESKISQKLPAKAAEKAPARAAEKKAKRDEPVRAPEKAAPGTSVLDGLLGPRNIAIAGGAAVLILAGVVYAARSHAHSSPAAPATAESAPIVVMPGGANNADVQAALQKIQAVSFSSDADDGLSQVEKLLAEIGSGTSATDRMARDLLNVAQGFFEKEKAVDDAEKLCNFDILSLKGSDDIAARQQAIGGLRDAQNGVVSYLQNIDSTCRTALAREGSSDADVTTAIAGFRKSANADALTSIWQAQTKLSSDHIARFEFMKQNVSGWMYKDGKLLFANQSLLDQYNGYLDSLRADVKAISDLQKQVAPPAQASAGQ